MLSFQQLACRRDGDVLFDDVNLVIHAGQKAGVVGKNGCGKSSLFQMVLGHLDSDDGFIGYPQATRLSHVAQDTPSVDRSAIEYVIDGHKVFRQLELAAQSAEVRGGVEYAQALSALEDVGAYQINSQASALLNGLGFSTEQHSAGVGEFSGGWRMRLNLAQALMCPCDLLLLDEPTNHLDLDAVLWLEHWLRGFDGTVLLISHDREFLDRVCTHIAHIERKKITMYRGNYSAFEKLRAAQLANQQAMFERQQKQRQHMQNYVDRFRAQATKARQAQSRLKMLERMEEIGPAHVDSEFSFSFEEPTSLPNPLLTLDEVALGYGDHRILNNVSLSIQQGDRIGLLGANGAGKSTLVKALVGDLALEQGERQASRNLVIGYFAQHQVDDLPADSQPLTLLLQRYSELSESDGRKYLGGYGFHGDAVFQTIHTLSGGERARLALALIIRRKPNLLLLDEPTNHLDIDMRHALTDALQGFNGALVVISHDRSLLRASVDTLWLVANKAVKPFEDDLDGYAKWLSDQRSSQGSSPSSMGGSTTSSDDRQDSAQLRKERKQADAEKRKQLAPLRRVVEKQSSRVGKLSDKLGELRNRLGANDLYSEDRKAELTELLQEEAALASKLVDAEDELLTQMETLEQAERGDVS